MFAETLGGPWPLPAPLGYATVRVVPWCRIRCSSRLPPCNLSVQEEEWRKRENGRLEKKGGDKVCGGAHGEEGKGDTERVSVWVGGVSGEPR